VRGVCWGVLLCVVCVSLACVVVRAVRVVVRSLCGVCDVRGVCWCVLLCVMCEVYVVVCCCA
jgi:hypothetical protein